jgi:hypothetical protein
VCQFEWAQRLSNAADSEVEYQPKGKKAKVEEEAEISE